LKLPQWVGKFQLIRKKWKEYYEIKIKDQGKGMTTDEIEKVFDPFYTTKEPGKGMGIGLYICSQIMKIHRGSIDIHSSPGKGTEVLIKIPLKN